MSSSGGRIKDLMRKNYFKISSVTPVLNFCFDATRKELEHGGERCQLVDLPVKEGGGLVEDIKNVHKSGESSSIYI